VREQTLEDIATDYFAAADVSDKVYAQRDRDVAAAEAKAVSAVAASIAVGDNAIRAMLALDVPQAEVRTRLGCAPADLRRATGTTSGAGGADRSSGDRAGVDRAGVDSVSGSAE